MTQINSNETSIQIGPSIMQPRCTVCGEAINPTPGSIHFCSEINKKHIVLDEIEKDDSVNHPAHYTSHPSGVECIEITRWMNFNLGNACKYIWRAGLKGRRSKLIEDLKKARWYIEDEIKRLENSK